MSIPRFRPAPGACAREHPEGEFVWYADHLAEVERLKRDLAVARSATYLQALDNLVRRLTLELAETRKRIPDPNDLRLVLRMAAEQYALHEHGFTVERATVARVRATLEVKNA